MSFYDEAGHLVGFDWEMLDVRNQEIKFCGYIKCITDDNPLPESGVPVTDVGPLTGWWIAGYGTGETLTLGMISREISITKRFYICN